MRRTTKTKESKVSKLKRFFKVTSRLLYDYFYSFLFNFFKSVNLRAKSNINLWYIKHETLQHVDSLIKVFKWVVLPASLIYVCADFYFFGENALESMFLGILIFFYSNFLPDLPSIYRKRKSYSDVRDLSWKKKYALLLFAPLFIGAFFCGIRLRWKTTETFHNFKSLTIYGLFLLLLSLFAFGGFPFSIGNITKILSLPFYGLIGYFTHLKVDKTHKWCRITYRMETRMEKKKSRRKWVLIAIISTIAVIVILIQLQVFRLLPKPEVTFLEAFHRLVLSEG